MGRRYYFKSKTSNDYFFVEHGVPGFHKTSDIKNQKYLDSSNLSEGVSKSQIIAAEICGLSGDWSKFSEIVDESASD